LTDEREQRLRLTLTIFALIGLGAIALLIFIGTGLLHLSSLDRLATSTGVGPATTQPATDPDEIDDQATTDPDAAAATQPTMVDRSVFLSAADARLAGPKIELLARDNYVLKTGDGRPPAPPPDFPEFRGSRDGRHHRVPPPPFLARWVTPEDCAEWDFESPAEGTYSVNFVYSGPPNRTGKTGGPFVVSIGTEQIIVSPKPTTNGTSFEMADVGELHLPKGQVRLTVRAEGKLTYETSIRLRSVRLFPAE
jgi:hypothetical protein